MDRRTDRQMDGQAQTNMPPQLLQSWGHNKLENTMHYTAEISPNEYQNQSRALDKGEYLR